MRALAMPPSERPFGLKREPRHWSVQVADRSWNPAHLSRKAMREFSFRPVKLWHSIPWKRSYRFTFCPEAMGFRHGTRRGERSGHVRCELAAVVVAGIAVVRHGLAWQGDHQQEDSFWTPPPAHS